LNGRTPHRLDLGLRFSEFRQDFEGFYGFVIVDAAHRETDMNQHPFANARVDRMIVVDDARYVDLALNAANVDRRETLFAVINGYDASGDTEAHWLVPY
jgi:hypothetical protein